MKASDQLKLSYIECESLDDLLEIMEDNWLLSKKWKEAKREIWEQTEHNKWHISDPLERSWLSLTAHHKNYLIAEAKKWGLNKRANEFVLSKTDTLNFYPYCKNTCWNESYTQLQKEDCEIKCIKSLYCKQ